MTTPTVAPFDFARIAAPGMLATDAPHYAICDTLAEPNDNFCAECGTPLGEPPAPVTMIHAAPERPAKLTNRERVARSQAELAAAVAALKDSDAWKRGLATMARFRRYSVNNQLLIAYQRPDASYVRGFKSWLDVGRAVRKGEHGIAILAPRPCITKDGDDEQERGVWFAVVKVFDYAQTDAIPGHPHQWEPPQRHAATGNDANARELWNAMIEYAEERDLTVSTDAAHAAAPTTYGYFAPTLHRIWVRPDRSLADMAATLAHELAHAVTDAACAAMARDRREVVAESVAYAVGSYFGLDMALRSAHYVASWLDEPETFKATMSAIHDGAATLIDALDAAMTGEPMALAA